MEKIQKYLQNNIDDKAELNKWEARGILSLHLVGSFEFYQINMLETAFLLVRPYEKQTIEKQQTLIRIIKEQTGMSVAILLEEASTYRIKKMLQERIPFIAVDQQMYLPFMALQLKRYINHSTETPLHEKFTPATQLIYLYILYSDKDEFDLDELSVILHLSLMTSARAMNELKNIGLVDYTIRGKTARKKVFKRITLKDYYSKGRVYLMDPVRKTIFVSKLSENLKAYKSDLTALGEQTMLGEPLQMIYAVDSKAESILKPNQVPKDEGIDKQLPKIQIMKYDIDTLAVNGFIDPISLILALKEKDDRIELAIKELMEDYKWFEE